MRRKINIQARLSAASCIGSECGVWGPGSEVLWLRDCSLSHGNCPFYHHVYGSGLVFFRKLSRVFNFLGITGQIRFLRGTFQSLDFVILLLLPARTSSEAPWHVDYIY